MDAMSLLKEDHRKVKKMLAELDDKRQNLTQTMLRIQGAMQVLRELLDQGEAPAGHQETPS